MTIHQLFRNIKQIAASVKTVRSAYDGDVYTIWNTDEVKYASVVVSLNYGQKQDNTRVYNVILYYGDRLMQDNSNKNSIFDDAFNTLQTIINELTSVDGLDTEEYTIRFFEQKFADDLAGAWVELNVTAEDELGACEINDIITEDEQLIEKLKELIRQYERENAELALVLKEILFKISGEQI